MTASEEIPVSPPAPSMTAEELPIPPRFWWLKRIAIASIVLIVALAGLRLWWGYEAHRRLQAEIDRIVAAGEPIYPEDFDSKNTVPDDQNAVKALDEAVVAQASLNDDESKIIADVLVGSVVTPNWEGISGILAINQDVFQRLRLGRARSKVEWELNVRGNDVIASFIPSCSGYRALSKLARVNALYQHRNGNDAAAVESLLGIRWIAEVLYAYPTLIPQLVGEASDGLLCDTIERVQADLQVASEITDERTASHPAARTEIVKLIESLGNQSGTVKGMQESLRSERMFQLAILKQIEDGTVVMSSLLFYSSPPFSDFAHSTVLSPLLELDTLKAMRWTGRQMELIPSDSWKEMQEFKTAIDREATVGATSIDPFFGSDLPSTHRAITLYFKARALRQMAATALAIRLYQLDHDGQRPRELAELVPDYLPSLPMDPFADGKPIGYRPDADPPYLYTVFEDGVDQGGEYKLNPLGFVERSSPDWPFFLARNSEQERLFREEEVRQDEAEARMREIQSNQTGENNPDEKAGGGQGGKDQQPR